MKKRLLSAVAFTALLASCNTTPKYTINGTVNGEETGNVFLIQYNQGKADTLGRSALTQGKFTIEGSVNEIAPAYLMIEGKRYAAPIFIENAAFTANLNPTKASETSITGTPTQEIATQFEAINAKFEAEQAKLYQEFSTAMQAKDEAKANEIRAQFDQLTKATQEQEDALIAANTNSIVSAFVIAQKMGGLKLDELKVKFESLSPEVKATIIGKVIGDRIAKVESVAIGQIAPDFTLNTPEGEPLSMHSVKGKVKIIDFWASWCGPCRGENPNVVKIYEEYHPKGLEIISVSLDRDKEAWLQAIKDDNLGWHHVSDLKFWQCEAAQQYAVNGIPHIVILDENNKIIAKNLRGEELENKIKELLQ